MKEIFSWEKKSTIEKLKNGAKLKTNRQTAQNFNDWAKLESRVVSIQKEKQKTIVVFPKKLISKSKTISHVSWYSNLYHDPRDADVPEFTVICTARRLHRRTQCVEKFKFLTILTDASNAWSVPLLWVWISNAFDNNAVLYVFAFCCHCHNLLYQCEIYEFYCVVFTYFLYLLIIKRLCLCFGISCYSFI